MPAYEVFFQYYINNHFEGTYQVIVPEYLKKVCDETNDYKTENKRYKHTNIELIPGIKLLEDAQYPSEEEYEKYKDNSIESSFYRELMSVWGFLLTEQLEKDGYFDVEENYQTNKENDIKVEDIE